MFSFKTITIFYIHKSYFLELYILHNLMGIMLCSLQKYWILASKMLMIHISICKNCSINNVFNTGPQIYFVIQCQHIL